MHSFNCAAAWTVSQLEEDTSWIHVLSEPHQNELKNALLQFKESVATNGLAQKVREGTLLPSKDNFILPTLGPLLEQAQLDLEEGCGVVLFQNFPLDCSEDDSRLMYGGMLSYIGTPQPQTVMGELLQPIQDEGQANLYERRGSKHHLGLPVHNDGCDVVGFLCRRTPLSGGETILASAVAIHNEMLRTCPDQLTILYQDFANAWQDYMYPEGRNTEATTLPRTWSAPVFSERDGEICCRYSRFYTDRAQNFPGVAQMSESQIDALDTFDRYINDKESWQYRRHFQEGDVMFVNNHVLLHSRTEFINGEELHNQRQLYRAWMAVPNSRPLAESMKVFFGNVEPGSQRGGVKKEFMTVS
ncbi:hypothetical protein BOW39_12970 [Solemya velum gill symbiont]|nr:hypothetical protein BOW39_12970 [Solemya velum gill symbiont]